MSLYTAHTHKRHYVCFDCRKQFKRPNPFALMAKDGVSDKYNRLDFKRKGMIAEQDNTLEMPPSEEQEWLALQSKYFGDALCPQCRQPMQHVHSNFKAPKLSDLHKWAELKKGMGK